MQSESKATNSLPVDVLDGKLVAIIPSRSELRLACDSLEALGIREVVVLDGAEGMERLLALQKNVSEFYFGDVETAMAERYVAAVSEGKIVFTSVVDADNVTRAAEVIRLQGASEITHFGNSVITNY